MQRRTRLSLIIVALVLAALVLAAVITARALLKPARFTAMLQNYASGAGLVLVVDGGAQPQLWPRPAVRLHRVRLSVPDAASPVISANEVRLVVPWRTLLGGTPAISQLRLRAPKVDLDQLRALLARHPAQPSAGPPTIPDVDAGIQIRDGRLLQGRAVLLQDINLTTGAFANGRPFKLRCRARTASGQPLQAHLSTVAQQSPNKLTLDALQLKLASGEQSNLQLSGQLDWQGGARFEGQLHGPLVVADSHYSTTLKLLPQVADAPLRVLFGLDGDATHVALRMAPSQLVQWWQGVSADTPTALTLPPLRGSVEADKLDVGSMQVKGLRIDSGPVPAASAAPAATASVDSR